MGFSVGGGIGPVRYSKSISAGKSGGPTGSGPRAITTDAAYTVYAWVLGCLILAGILVMVWGWLLVIPVYLVFKIQRVAWWADKRSLNLPDMTYQEWLKITEDVA